jgi:hypothetical protein
VVKACDIVEPVPALAPDTPVCTTVQAKVVPPILLVKAIDGATPEQTVCEEGVATTSGVGFTVIEIDAVAEFVHGVVPPSVTLNRVYVKVPATFVGTVIVKSPLPSEVPDRVVLL